MGLVITRVRRRRRRRRRAAVRVLSSSSSRCSGSTSKRGFDNYNAGNLYYLCAAVRCYAGPYAARVLRWRPVHLAAVTAGGATVSLSLTLAPSFKNWRQLRRPHALNGAAAIAAVARRAPRASLHPASQAASTSSAKIHAGSTVSSLKPAKGAAHRAVLLHTMYYTVVLLLPATDEIRPTTATQPTAKSS